MLIPFGILSSAAGAEPAFVSEYELIETHILATAAPSITFTSLDTYASDYKHLQIRIAATADGSNEGRIRINGNTGSNYAWHQIVGLGTSVVSTASLSQTSMGLFYTSGNTVGAGVIDLLDSYSTTKNKTIKILQGQAGASSGALRLALTSGVFLSTSSTASITLIANITGGNYLAGSRFSIYGIRG